MVLNAGYVQWAGVTAGKHGSFYDYLAGGDTWKDFFSPDHSGTPINLLAYTATFGGGFSATLSLEQNESVAGVNIAWYHHLRLVRRPTTSASTAPAARHSAFARPTSSPALDVTQSWGGAHLAGVAHNVRLEYSGSAATDLDTWGYGVIGGVTFNLPMLSAGSKIAFQGAYAHGAIAYSGATSPAWGEQDQGFNTNGNGTLFPMADAIYTGGDTWALSNAWSAAAQLTWKVSPNFEIDPEIAYASVDYGSSAATYWDPILSQKATAWWVGAVFDWSPVKNLDFALDAVYESSHQSTPLDWADYRDATTRSTTTRTASTPASTSSARSDRPPSGRQFGPGAKAPGFFVLADLAEPRLCSGECARHSPIRQRQRQTRRAVGGRQEEGLDGSASSRAAPISFAIGDERVATAIASPICGGRGVLRATLARSPAGTATGRGSRSPRDRPRQVCDRRVAAGPRR